jgi:hypothetical protein
MPGAYVWKKVLGWVSLHIGTWGGGRSTGKCERMMGALGMGHLSLKKLNVEGLTRYPGL